MHYCTWKLCGAPATKRIRIRLVHPIKQMRWDGSVYEVEPEWRNLWRCDKHYQAQSEHWDIMERDGVFLVER